LSAAYIHLIWIGATDWSLWWGLAVSLVAMGVVMRWG
jgi:predicted small integral membrane protein